MYCNFFTGLLLSPYLVASWTFCTIETSLFLCVSLRFLRDFCKFLLNYSGVAFVGGGPAGPGGDPPLEQSAGPGGDPPLGQSAGPGGDPHLKCLQELGVLDRLV